MDRVNEPRVVQYKASKCNSILQRFFASSPFLPRTTELLSKMVLSSKLFSSVLLAVTYASMSAALVAKDVPNHSTHRTRHISRDLKLETYHPPTTYEVRSAITILRISILR